MASDMFRRASDDSTSSERGVMVIASLQNELTAERALSDERLVDIRRLQQEVSNLRLKTADDPRDCTGGEGDLRKAVEDERRRADAAHAVAEERLADIRGLQQQLNQHRLARSSAGGAAQALKQAEAKVAALTQRESTLCAELQRESEARREVDRTLASRTEEARLLQSQVTDLRAQLLSELNKHQLELEAWQQERDEIAGDDNIARSPSRLVPLTLVSDTSSAQLQHLRKQADKEWTIAEERLEQIRALQSELAAAHVSLASLQMRAAEDNSETARMYQDELKTVRHEHQQQLAVLKKHLLDERAVSADRSQKMQALERRTAELQQRLSEMPEGESTRSAQLQKQLETTLGVYRAEADDATRRHRAEMREAERKLEAEQHARQERDSLLREALQRESRLKEDHQKELLTARGDAADEADRRRKAEELLRTRRLDYDSVLQKKLDGERKTAADRLDEIRALQKQIHEIHDAHNRDIAEQHAARERLEFSVRDTEEETRRRLEASLTMRERELAERERQHLTAKEEAVKQALAGSREKEDAVRREAESKAAAACQRLKEEAKQREAHYEQRLKDMEQLHKVELDAARERELRAAAANETNADSASKAQRDLEELRNTFQREHADTTRARHDELRHQQGSLRDATSALEAKKKENDRLRTEAAALRAQAAAMARRLHDAEEQLAALETELARHVGLLNIQKDEISTTKGELGIRTAQTDELTSARDTALRELEACQKTLAQQPDATKLQTENVKLLAEIKKLKDREARLRHWAQQVHEAQAQSPPSVCG